MTKFYEMVTIEKSEDEVTEIKVILDLSNILLITVGKVVNTRDLSIKTKTKIYMKSATDASAFITNFPEEEYLKLNEAYCTYLKELENE